EMLDIERKYVNKIKSHTEEFFNKLMSWGSSGLFPADPDEITFVKNQTNKISDTIDTLIGTIDKKSADLNQYFDFLIENHSELAIKDGRLFFEDPTLNKILILFLKRNLSNAEEMDTAYEQFKAELNEMASESP
ncbi:hypothetical protein ACFL2V_22045, partial [Pseudomonadota bacterium]